MRKKNRKLRRLRELYPGVRIKLFYARDFRTLLLKFGRLALLDDLSGHDRPGDAAARRRGRGRAADAVAGRRQRRPSGRRRRSRPSEPP